MRYFLGGLKPVRFWAFFLLFGAFCLSASEASAQTFSNTNPITIPSLGQATPYPSNITVSGISGSIANVSISLNGLSHTFPDDIDIMLVSPTGTRLILMSDAGNGFAVSSLNLTFDDTGTPLPNSSVLISTTYSPTDYVGNDINDVFPAPAPAPANPGDYPAPTGTATFASKFNGLSPNGTWSLYVVDDQSGDSGSISGGWSITITPSAIPPTQTFSNSNPITFPSFGTATPYPSDITVSGVVGTVTHVTVKLFGLTHTFPDDIDIMLVSPTGAKLILMSDAGNGFAVSNVNLTFDDTGIPLPNSSLITTTTYTPNDYAGNDVNDIFPAPAPAPANPGDYPAPTGTATLASKFNNANPNGTWSLYLTDDQSGDSGSISGGWSITFTVSPVSPTTFSNANPITIPSIGAATPYPSNITVSGISALNAKITVTINGLTHTFPDDLDIMLVSPTGAKLILMSDAGNGFAVSNINLTFEDMAAAQLPNSSLITTGSFRPTDYVGNDVNDVFPAPAPAPANPGDYPAPTGTATFASKFNGLSPNGTWSLYVVDDQSGDSGSISGGWSISFAVPTAAGVSVSGRVFDSEGRALPRAIVQMIGPDGNTRTARTNPFGYFTFTDVPAGETYVVFVTSKLYEFSSQVVTVNDPITDLNFEALP